MRTVSAVVRGMVLELFRKKDFTVFFVLLVGLMFILSSQNFFNVENITRYIKDFGYTTVIIFSFLITVILSSRQVPSELNSRTIYPLLAKPISRFGFLFSKFAGSVAVSVISFVAYFTAFALLAFRAEGGLNPALMLESVIFGILFLSLVSALVIFFSTFLTMSANVSITLLLYFFISTFADPIRDMAFSGGKVTSVLAGILYYVIPHFEFFDLRIRITHAWDPLSAWVVGAVAFYAVAYCAILLFFAGLIFRRKPL